jgi:ComF family protein
LIIFHFITKQSTKLIEQLLPAQCLVCALPSNNKLICEHCEKKIFPQQSHCLHCALPLIQNADYCGQCLSKSDSFGHIHALGDYTKPLSTLIKQLKYQQQLIAGELLASLLLKSVLLRYSKQQLSQFDFLLAVPLHKKKLRQRGFNQAQIICDYLHQHLNIPIMGNNIKRVKETMPQEGLTINKREANLRAAFAYDETLKLNLKGKNVVIIDDVVTTGATINSLCKLLKKRGANSITIFCICRTSLTK